MLGCPHISVTRRKFFFGRGRGAKLYFFVMCLPILLIFVLEVDFLTLDFVNYLFNIFLGD